jgi:hypothetical protein
MIFASGCACDLIHYWCGALLINNSSYRRIRKKGLCSGASKPRSFSNIPHVFLSRIHAHPDKKAGAPVYPFNTTAGILRKGIT